MAALNGAFQGRVEEPVNYVNAPLVAQERGIEVREERRPASRDFRSLVAVTAVAGGEEFNVVGTVMGSVLSRASCAPSATRWRSRSSR